MTVMWLRMTAMWTAMMVPMMLPSLLPRLRAWPLRAAVVAACAYFFVWALCGAAVYPPLMWVPVERYAGLAFVAAGAMQLTPWKVQRLERCRAACTGETRHAWRDGLRMGVDCALCCAGYTLVLLVTGMMNLAAMVLVTIAITAERLAPRPALLARAFGVVLIAAAAFVTGSPPRM
jgi:predicted metal-binding membrane protein